MNKLVKGSIAGAAGIALLLGGAGTLALWNDTAAIDDVTVNSGALTLSAADSDWAGGATMVPGDVATYATTVTINATGDTIQGTLELDGASITGDAEFSDDLEITLAPNGAASIIGGGVLSNANGVFTFDGAGTYTIPVIVTVTFDQESDNDSQSKAVELEGAHFFLTQTVTP